MGLGSDRVDELKQEYNKILKRFYKANEWFNDSDRTVEEQDKYIGEFEKILEGITKNTLKLEKLGIKMTGEIFINGFD